MALIIYNIKWESEVGKTVSEKNKVQDMNITQLKLEVHDTSKKMKK